MTHEKQCDEFIDLLNTAAALVAKVKEGDKDAAVELGRLCRHISYDGCVLYVRMEDVIAPVLNDD